MILNFVSNFSYIMPTETNRDFIRLIKYGERGNKRESKRAYMKRYETKN